jgi:hypothetical protein
MHLEADVEMGFWRLKIEKKKKKRILEAENNNDWITVCPSTKHCILFVRV